jgi:methylmalonyl-CoA mutase cobalamin-binding subunit
MSVADSDPCAQWLQRAWMDLKSPLVEAGGAPAQLKADAQRIQDLMQAVCCGDLHAARGVCVTGQNPVQPSLGQSIGLLLSVIECIEHEWQTDRLSYTDTLYAYWNVQRLIQQWDEPADFFGEAASTDQGRILLASAPGCQHQLGVLVVADHFRVYGWQVQALLDASRRTLLQAVQEQKFDVIGLSVGHDAGLEGLADLIRELRQVNVSASPRVLVGGNIFNHPYSAYDWLGADGVATSAQEALLLCRAWVKRNHH